jgi:copper(I)-binding protein
MRTLVALLAAVLLVGAADAHEFTLGDLSIEHPWAPPSLAGQNQGAVYFTIRNDGDAPDRLIAVRTDAAATAELHGHVMTGDIARMTPVEAVDVPARGEAAFAPGGLHVMLLGLDAPLALEDSFALTLVFERGGEVEIEAHVESLARHLTAPGETVADGAHPRDTH